jgi:hypothetical protein
MDVDIDVHPKCYDVQLARGWAGKMFNACESSPALDEIGFDFVAAMRGTAHVARVPFVMLEQLRHFHDGYVRHRTTKSPVEQVARAFVLGAAQRMRSLTPPQLTELHGVLLELGHGIRIIDDSPALDFPEAEAWQGMLKTGEFRIYLRECQRTCYVALYNAYESFVTGCIRLTPGRDRFRKRSAKKFEQALRDSFDASILNECWANAEIQHAGSLRHSLSHAAGRETHDLKGSPRLKAGRVQVTVSHVRDLLRVIETKSLILAEAAAVVVSRSTTSAPK